MMEAKPVEKKAKEKMLVKSNMAGIYQAGTYARLVPGMNQVDKDMFEQIKALPSFQKRMKLGMFEVPTIEKRVDKPEKDKDDPVPDSVLDDFNATEAVKVVKDTLSIETLTTWKKSEKRKTVLNAIDEQSGGR